MATGQAPGASAPGAGGVGSVVTLRRDDTDRPVVPLVGDPRRSAVPIRDRLRFELEGPPVEDDDCDCRGCAE